MRVISNTAISLDGKTSLHRDVLCLLGTAEDRRRMHEIRAGCDALLVGGETFRVEPMPLFAKAEVLKRAVAETPIFNVVLTRNLSWLKKGMLDHPRVKPLILTKRQPLPEDFPYPVEFCDEEISPKWIVSVLEKRGVKCLLIEAGGRVILPFQDAGLLDEIYLTLTPQIIGDNAAPSFMDGKMQSRVPQRLKLITADVVGDEVFLHYSR